MIQNILLYTAYAIAIAALIITSFINIAPQFGSNPTSEQKKYYGKFPNYKEGGFKSIEETPMMTGELSTWDFFKKDSTRQPQDDIITKKVDFNSFMKIDNQDYKITWLGHSTFLLNIDNKIILLDPMLGTHAAPIPLPNLKRYHDSLPITPDSLKQIDVVLVSHDHYDHLDYSTIKLIKDNVKKFIVPYGVGNHLKKWKVEKEKILELNWYESIKIDILELTCLPARHFSGRGPLNRNSTLWSSWSLHSPTIKIYFSGDSGYGEHIKQIGRDYGPFDISLIDCGQYNKAWKHSHMFPQEAILAAKDLGTKYFMPIHWGGFTLAMHPWDQPVKESIKLAKKLKIPCLTPEIGEIITKENINSISKPWWNSY